MSTIHFSILENPKSTCHVWKQWKSLVDSEGWTVDDNATTTLIPIMETTRSVFAVDENNDFIGCVIWNENEKIAWLGYFLLVPKWRGKGVGSKIWALAMEKYSKNSILALRGVPVMAAKYKAQDCPISGPILRTYRIGAVELQKAMLTISFKDLDLKIQKLRDLKPSDWQKFLDYDKSVTGKNRSNFLDLYYKSLNLTVGFLFSDPETEDLKGIISLVPTGQESENLLKISHLYADSDDVAFFALKTISLYIFSSNKESTVFLHTVDGFNLIRDFMEKDLEVQGVISGYTLYSEEESEKDQDLTPLSKKVHLPHNSSCHFDF